MAEIIFWIAFGLVIIVLAALLWLLLKATITITAVSIGQEILEEKRRQDIFREIVRSEIKASQNENKPSQSRQEDVNEK